MTWVYALLGALMLVNAAANLRRRGERGSLARATFWGVLGIVVAAGEFLPAATVGAAVITVAVIALSGGMRPTPGVAASAPDALAIPATHNPPASPFGNRIFVPALLIPFVTVIIVFGFKAAERSGLAAASAQQSTLLALAIACVVATAAACALTRSTPRAALHEGNRLLDAIGWAAVLPLMLAMLGAVFSAAGVGDVVAELMRAWVPTDSRLACVLAYALGMALFTMLMGNAFAAFPVITAGIGLPLLVQQHGADAASLAAIGMLSGYCGTLLTPMAANYNLVPAALLELPDRNGVIRAQVATALPLLACNIALMYFIPFR